MPAEIPDDLLVSAYFAQNGEAAWARDDALKVLAWAAAREISVLGVEVWIPTIPGPTIPTPYIYTFESRQMLGESRMEFKSRANSEAAEYVRSFQWDHKDTSHHGVEPFFNLTLAGA